VLRHRNPITPPDPARREAARAKYHLLADDKGPAGHGREPGRGRDQPRDRRVLEANGQGDWKVIWSTGGELRRVQVVAPAPVVQVFPFIDPMADAYAVADLAVARGGMMTGAELCAWGIPSVIIPLPSAAADHQTANAVALEVAERRCTCRRRN